MFALKEEEKVENQERKTKKKIKVFPSLRKIAKVLLIFKI